MKNARIVLLLAFAVCFQAVHSQTLTVRDIMAEPSIAGMRVAGERLSPDGRSVIYLWNPEGRLPRSLYIQSTSGGPATKLLSPSDLPPPTRQPARENRLNYGVDMRDQFVKDRENQLGNFEWSPDSKKLLFAHGGDMYVLDLDVETSDAAQRQSRERWSTYESNMLRRADLVPGIIQSAKMMGVQEPELYKLVTDNQQLLLQAIGKASNKSVEQRDSIVILNESLTRALLRLRQLPESYPMLRSNVSFTGHLDELAGTENRIDVARKDYNDATVKKRIKRYTRTQSPEFGARFLDNERILFSQGGNAFVLNIADSTLMQLTREANQQNFISVGNIVPNDTGTMIAYVVTDASKQRQLVVPNYLPEYVTGGGPRRGWTEQKLYVTSADGSRETPAEIKLPKVDGVSGFRRMVWTSDGQGLIVDRGDKDTKRRQLYFVNSPGTKSEQIIQVTEETDDKWQAPLSSIFESNPKNPSELFFASEKDGYNHLYLAKLTTTQPELEGGREISTQGGTSYATNVSIIQLTNGKWQVEWAKWTAGGDQIVISSTEENSAERQFYALFPQNGEKIMLPSSQKGMRTSPQMDDQNAQPTLLFSFSRWNQPDDLYVQKVCSKCREHGPAIRLTNSVPESFSKRVWAEPKFIDIPSRDGKIIKSKIYLPPGHNTKEKYPMAIFVHGAGYLQNTINGWNNYYREFMFNDLLTREGYVVLDIDYRGSAGYGREWRTDVYDFLGGKDYEDHIDAIDYMVKNYSVDQKRIGAYGGSYGGFMAGMLVLRAPERIAAAAALRPVFDWKNYYAANPSYTAQRLGFPDKNPEAYKRSSPISYADKLERPLLILHGISDDNVHVQDSMQMMEKLIRLGKTQYFEAMLYPSENHGFVRPESWTDEYERILAFFEKHLK
ncbi:MAG TPA: alpha/beta fold hydrolase [Pyrinomonadaceae bacterium]|nr:alpha/beta fold hydrolase [Pyrinomonadaceae bacterium]